jgi:hypothetical protein
LDQIKADHLRAGHGLHLRRIDGHHAAAARPARRHASHGDLCPSSGRGAEIDDDAPGLQEPQPVVELDQLEGGARPVACLPGRGDEGVGELAGEPARRGRRAALGGLDAHLAAPAGGPRHFTVGSSGHGA